MGIIAVLPTLSMKDFADLTELYSVGGKVIKSFYLYIFIGDLSTYKEEEIARLNRQNGEHLECTMHRKYYHSLTISKNG